MSSPKDIAVKEGQEALDISAEASHAELGSVLEDGSVVGKHPLQSPQQAVQQAAEAIATFSGFDCDTKIVDQGQEFADRKKAYLARKKL